MIKIEQDVFKDTRGFFMAIYHRKRYTDVAVDRIFLQALILKIGQGPAIIPGVSRSGSTNATGLFLGLDRETMANYSFLLSIPAVTGAGLMILSHIPGDTKFEADLMIIGGLTSFFVGYGSLRFLVYIVKKRNLNLFAPDCWIDGHLIRFLNLNEY